RIKINKNDELGKPIAGVKFILEKRQETSYDEYEWIPYGKEYYETDKNGEIEMILPVGVYKLVETETTGGHILDDNEVLFEIKSNDKV
ncbi:prealbumin-like fold domain-containing protein, partial [Acinetobacter baumannii]|nr:prealbumin-like fold domain-containing protein [Acinetobacter baumannii]